MVAQELRAHYCAIGSLSDPVPGPLATTAAAATAGRGLNRCRPDACNIRPHRGLVNQRRQQPRRIPATECATYRGTLMVTSISLYRPIAQEKKKISATASALSCAPAPCCAGPGRGSASAGTPPTPCRSPSRWCVEHAVQLAFSTPASTGPSPYYPRSQAGHRPVRWRLSLAAGGRAPTCTGGSALVHDLERDRHHAQQDVCSRSSALLGQMKPHARLPGWRNTDPFSG